MSNAQHAHLDEFGITKIYKDSTRSDAPQAFVMGTGNWKQRIEQWDEDNRGRTIGNFEGSGLDIVFTSLADDKQRMNVYADHLKPEVSKEAKKLDRAKLIQRPDNDGMKRGGWMAQTNDWRDYEVTAVEFFPSSTEGEDTSAWYGRGAKHTGDSIDEGSQGSAIKPDLFYAGNKGGWHALKETLHFDPFKGSNTDTVRSGGDSNILLIQNVGDVKDRWIGIKTVVYNKPKKVGNDGNEYWPVVIEAYFCNCDNDGNPDNNWELKFQCEDDPEKHGGWSTLPDGQPGPKIHTISWGGPIITCRTDRQSGTGGDFLV
jgi:hypothetical protein